MYEFNPQCGTVFFSLSLSALEIGSTFLISISLILHRVYGYIRYGIFWYLHSVDHRLGRIQLGSALNIRNLISVIDIRLGVKCSIGTTPVPTLK